MPYYMIVETEQHGWDMHSPTTATVVCDKDGDTLLFHNEDDALDKVKELVVENQYRLKSYKVVKAKVAV